MKIIEQRVRACQQREGPSYKQNCAKELQQFKEVSRAYQSRCECTYTFMFNQETWMDSKQPYKPLILYKVCHPSLQCSTVMNKDQQGA